MARTAKRRGKPLVPERQYFIFEIREWEPDYLLSVSHDRYRQTAYSEYVHISLATVCVHPKKLAGRTAHVTVSAEPNFMTPEPFKRDSEWKPRCVAAIHLPPTNANFSFSVPTETMVFLMLALSRGLFHYLLFWGPPLSRGWSPCSEVRLARTVDLNDY